MDNVSNEFVIKGVDSSDATFSEGTGIKGLSLNTSVGSSITYAKLGEGIWVEAVDGGSSTAGKYIDFHIRACWDPPFSSSTKATLGTIVRQYYE